MASHFVPSTGPSTDFGYESLHAPTQKYVLFSLLLPCELNIVVLGSFPDLKNSINKRFKKLVWPVCNPSTDWTR